VPPCCRRGRTEKTTRPGGRAVPVEALIGASPTACHTPETASESPRLRSLRSGISRGAQPESGSAPGPARVAPGRSSVPPRMRTTSGASGDPELARVRAHPWRLPCAARQALMNRYYLVPEQGILNPENLRRDRSAARPDPGPPPSRTRRAGRSRLASRTSRAPRRAGERTMTQRDARSAEMRPGTLAVRSTSAPAPVRRTRAVTTRTSPVFWNRSRRDAASGPGSTRSHGTARVL
jgi:hypothetical protein